MITNVQRGSYGIEYPNDENGDTFMVFRWSTGQDIASARTMQEAEDYIKFLQGADTAVRGTF